MHRLLLSFGVSLLSLPAAARAAISLTFSDSCIDEKEVTKILPLVRLG